MNRHDDELEKEIADKYIENMDAPDLWSRIEKGLDNVDAQRKMQNTESDDAQASLKIKRMRNKNRNSRIVPVVSGLAAAAVICVLILAGTLNNSRKKLSDMAQSENSVMRAADDNDMADENDAVAESAAESESAAQYAESDQESAESAENYMTYDSATARGGISESESDGKSVFDKPVVVTSSNENGDYIPMIMVDGMLYKDTFEMIDADEVDDSNALYAQSYTDGKPASDGEVNFDRNPSENSAYIKCDDESLIVKVEGNWYRFEKAE